MATVKVKIDMSIKNIDHEQKIKINEIYYSENFNRTRLETLDGKVKIIEIECKNCADAVTLWKEFDKNRLLPDYFGNNWNAFYDSIEYFEFFEEYDLVVFIFNNFSHFMEKEKIMALHIYNVMKESQAFKVRQKEDNKPPLTYIFNLSGSEDWGVLRDIDIIYHNNVMTVETFDYDKIDS